MTRWHHKSQCVAAHPLTPSLTHSLPHSLTHSLPHSLPHSLTHSRTRSRTHSRTPERTRSRPRELVTSNANSRPHSTQALLADRPPGTQSVLTRRTRSNACRAKLRFVVVSSLRSQLLPCLIVPKRAATIVRLRPWGSEKEKQSKKTPEKK